MDTSIAEPTADIDTLRLATFDTLVALARTHGLRMPNRIRSSVHDTAGPTMDMSFDRDDQVHRWAELLNIGPVTAHVLDGPEGTSWLEAFGYGLGKPVWLGWAMVYVRAYSFDQPAVVAEPAETNEHVEAASTVGDLHRSAEVEPVEAASEEEAPAGAIDLMAALRASVEQAKAARSPREPAATASTVDDRPAIGQVRCRYCGEAIAPTGHDNRWSDGRGRLNCSQGPYAHQPPIESGPMDRLAEIGGDQ